MKAYYGETKAGEKVSSYTLKNASGFEVVLLDYGAILDKLYVPDTDGKSLDVALGCGNIEDYEADANFFGCTVGPVANRIAKGEVPIDGITYNMIVNDGENNLHTDVVNGVHKRIWKSEELENGVKFTIELKDGEFGLPGNRVLEVTYSITEDNGLKIDYHAVSDKRTIFNMTNHTHFNLDGHGSGNVLEHELTINASKYTPVGAGAIPTGDIVSVLDTELDFTKGKKVGRDILSDNSQIQLVKGYDFNYVIDNHDGKLKEIAVLKGAKTDRIMKVYTDLPGVQLYTDNYVDNVKGKDKAVYNQRQGLCLETQCYPDSINHENFPDTIYGEGKEYHTTTIYKFE